MIADFGSQCVEPNPERLKNQGDASMFRKRPLFSYPAAPSLSSMTQKAKPLAHALLIWLCLMVSGPATAQGLVRDAEIEASLRKMAAPIFRAAGLGQNSVRIFMVKSSQMNAFVAGGNNMFLTTGLLSRLKTVEQIQAVLAHETGHIAGGHLVRLAGKRAQARNIALLGAIVAAGAAAAGSGEAATAIAASGGQVAQRNFLSYTRSEEANADQAAARYMASAGIDPRAVLDVLKLFAGQEALSAKRRDSYALTHPLSTERIRYLENVVATLRISKVKPDPSIPYWHARMVAKLNGFIRHPGATLKRIPRKDKSEVADLQRAIAYHRQGSLKKALNYLDPLLAKRPRDPFYHELRGQILLESGNSSAAAASYTRAVKLAPKEAQMRSGLGRALLAQDTSKSNKAALSSLKKAARMDRLDGRVLRDLALAYARAGDTGRASLVTAERYALAGRMHDMGLHATRASGLLTKGTPEWRQAQELVRLAERAKSRKK